MVLLSAVLMKAKNLAGLSRLDRVFRNFRRLRVSRCGGLRRVFDGLRHEILREACVVGQIALSLVTGHDRPR